MTCLMSAESAKFKVREHVILKLEVFHAEGRLAEVAWRVSPSCHRWFNVVVALVVTNHLAGSVKRWAQAIRFNATPDVWRLCPFFNHTL